MVFSYSLLGHAVQVIVHLADDHFLEEEVASEENQGHESEYNQAQEENVLL